MNITCDMAMDLMALYKDRLASDDSKRAVREHLKNCPECRRAYAQYSADKARPETPPCAPAGEELSQKYYKLAKHLHKQHLVSTAAVLAVVAVSIGAGAFCTIRMLGSRK